QILYLPCTIALCKERSHACYRIMLWLAVVDTIAIVVNSIAFGYILIEDLVFCSQPWFIWVVGCAGMGLWCGECIGCLLLVTFRLFEMLNIGARFEARTNMLIVFATCYLFYFGLFTPPVLSNARHMAMFFDPFIGHLPTEIYVNWPHTFNNLLVVLTSATLYAILCAIVLKEQCSGKDERAKISRKCKLQIFIQASLICVFNVAASLEYIYMNFFPTPQILIQLGHISWQIAHGE
ncbi:hypothetical protein PMAYCL1PPCAC_15542, partial [Pristionchus mayeri]